MIFIRSLILLVTLSLSHNLIASQEHIEINPDHCRIIKYKLTDQQDIKNMIEMSAAHAKSDLAKFYPHDFKKLHDAIKQLRQLQQSNKLDQIFDLYLLYYRDRSEIEKLVGDMTLSPTIGATTLTDGYIECNYLIHPQFRNKGLGYVFRKKFFEEIISPKIGQTIQWMYPGYASTGPVTIPTKVKGIKGFIHIDNIPSRKLVTKLGYEPAYLCFDKYIKYENKVTQIVYVYPPKESPISDDIKQKILSNKTEFNHSITSVAHDLQAKADLNNNIRASVFQIMTSANGSLTDIFYMIKNKAQECSQEFPIDLFDQAFKEFPKDKVHPFQLVMEFMNLRRQYPECFKSLEQLNQELGL